MLQHAIAAATRFRDNAEITLFALWDGEHEGELGTGGIGHVVQLATLAGIKVHTISPPPPKANKQVITEQTPPADSKGVIRIHS